MQSFTTRLTNGIFIPSYRTSEETDDIVLKSLLKYIDSYSNVDDFRQKVKNDFNLLSKFNGFK